MVGDAFASDLIAAKMADDDVTSSAASCQELNRIASDFHELMVAHCPLCNGVGPQCIVESMEEALAGGAEDQTDADTLRLRQ